MPCRSDYMDPTGIEEALQETAQLLVYVKTKLGKPVSRSLAGAAKNPYCHTDYVPELCKMMRSLSADQIDAIVYNSRDKTSRKLADWWEEHQEADRIREEQEKADKARQELVYKVLKTFTKAEIDALREYFHTEWMKS